MAHQLNLIDERLLPVAARPSVAALLALAGVCVVVAWGHLSWERGQLARSLAQPGAEAVASDGTPGADAAHDARLAQLLRDERLRDALAGFSDLPQHSARRLQQLAAALPDQLWLSEVELQGSRGVRIVGGTLDPAALSGYATRLGQLEDFSGLPLQALTVEQAERPVDESALTGVKPPAWHHFVLTSGSMTATHEEAAR